MLQIELVGGPRCGDRPYLDRESLPSEYEVQMHVVMTAEEVKTLTFKYVPTTSPTPTRRGAYVLEFVGYEGGFTRA